MKTLDIAGVKIGSGCPKICVPILAIGIEDIARQVQKAEHSDADMLELRIDYFQNICTDFVKEGVKSIRNHSKKPIILTYRSGFEGGEGTLTKEEYGQLLLDLLDNVEVELLDVELFTGDEIVKNIVTKAHQKNVKVIMSNHNFHETNEADEIVSRLQKMEQLGADIAKIALMPVKKQDVVTLLGATVRAEEMLQIPIVTMSMAGMGLASRLCGELFGSVITFGSVMQASAPGQIHATELKQVLQIIHKNIGGDKDEL